MKTGSQRTVVEKSSRPVEFDWKKCWYPVSFLQDLERNKPTSVSVYDIPLVLFFDQGEKLTCLHDVCPHRSARLSEGQIIDGRLECLYHGWQFGADGDCLHIPQLLPDKSTPIRACARSYPVAVQQDIVWIWAGDASDADITMIPESPVDGRSDIFDVTFQMDLPYDQSYLIENVIDVAHIHIAHDGVRGGGLREAAKPLEFEIHENSVRGIRSTFRSAGLEPKLSSRELQGALVEFIAPNLVRYTSRYKNSERVAGLELYSLPSGRGKCRLLYRKYSNFTGWRERLKPRWSEHQVQCLILEQDMALVVGQHEEIERSNKQLCDLWLPLKSSDRLVIEYRKWLDRFGRDLPFYRGFSSAENSCISSMEKDHSSNRHVLHTRICSSCSKLHARVERAVTLLWISGLGVLAASFWFSEFRVRLLLSLLMLLIFGLIFILQRFRERL